MSTASPIKPRERDAIVQSLRAGVVHGSVATSSVGTSDEVAAVLDDLIRIEQGGAAVRFVIGKFGAGKSFFSQFGADGGAGTQVCGGASRRYHRTTIARLDGPGSALYAELMQNLATRQAARGGAIASVGGTLDLGRRSSSSFLRRFDFRCGQAARDPTQAASGSGQRLRLCQRDRQVSARLSNARRPLMAAALRWLRAEYSHQDRGPTGSWACDRLSTTPKSTNI